MSHEPTTAFDHAAGPESLADRFGHRVRQRLDEAANALPARTVQRLAASRTLAMARHQSPVAELAVSAGRGGTMTLPSGPDRFQQWMLIGSALILALGLMGLDQWRQAQVLDETVDIDQAILSDDLPFTAHLDPLYPEMLRREQ